MDVFIKLMNAIGKIERGRFGTGDQAKPQGEERRTQNNSRVGVCQVKSDISKLFP